VQIPVLARDGWRARNTQISIIEVGHGRESKSEAAKCYTGGTGELTKFAIYDQ
jgi:hypothetical protein